MVYCLPPGRDEEIVNFGNYMKLYKNNWARVGAEVDAWAKMSERMWMLLFGARAL